MREHKEQLGRLLSLDVGKIYQEGLGEVEEMGTDLSSVWLDIAGAKLGTADGNDPNQDNETLPVDFHQFASEFLLQEDDDGAMDTILLGS